MQLKECYESTKAILASQKSNIRFINVPPLGSYKPLTDIKADWVVAAPENVEPGRPSPANCIEKH